MLTLPPIIRDDLGYNSALRDIGNRIGDDLDRFPLDSLISQWGNAASVTERIEQKKRVGYADPKYDRVFWSLSLVVLLVYVLTGTTLDQARKGKKVLRHFFSSTTPNLNGAGPKIMTTRNWKRSVRVDLS
ncbi:MAG: hypothetical protein CM1200mP24_08050 [Gammaproteobacteria bacterium]|nr:MAG: hypothetical protein CM1200mP24_08050 [Gammaproteobacteria bacterium]